VIIWVSGTVILFIVLAIAGIAMQIAMNIAAIIFNILMFAIFFIGLIIHINQMKDSVFGATKLTGALSILSAFHTLMTIMYMRIELHWELTTWKIIICGLIFIVAIAINSFACYLTDEKRNNFKMCLITLGVIVAVAVSGFAYFVHEDKILAKDDIEEIYTYIVTSDSAEIYNVEKGTAWSVVEKKQVESDTIGDDVIGTCQKGDILTNEHGGIGGKISVQKIRTEDGILGYVYSANIEPYEYTTRYQLQYE